VSDLWNEVHAAAIGACPKASMRVANLAIAAAARYARKKTRKPRWSGDLLRNVVADLALTPLPRMSTSVARWQKVAEAAMQAAPLGHYLDGMHLWAAAYQAATATQKSLGAYATHHAFARMLALVAVAPLAGNRTLRVLDPSAGAGNLLLAYLEQVGLQGTDAQARRVIRSVHGVELDPQVRELCCLLIWLVGEHAGVTLGEVSENIVLGNAITMDWWDREPYDMVLMNPPWESLRHETDHDHEGERAKTIARLSVQEQGHPDLPLLFSAQGKGDRNLFKAFVELAPHLLREEGRLGALLPAAFASDAGMAPLRQRYLEQFEIAQWTSFENRLGLFPIDGRYKFGLLAATRSPTGTREFYVRSFATKPEEVLAPHIVLSREDVDLLGRQYHIIPEISDAGELATLRKMLSRGTRFFETGSVGRVVYRREVDLTIARGEFQHFAEVKPRRQENGTFIKAGRQYVPLVEGRMVGQFDCFQKSWVEGKGRTAVWKDNDDAPVEQCTPQYIIEPAWNFRPRVAFCDVTSATNTRTMIATHVPSEWRCGNTAPVLEFDSRRLALAGLGILNSMVFDWMARRMLAGLHLNKFILEGLVWPQLPDDVVTHVAAATRRLCAHYPRPGVAGRRRGGLEGLAIERWVNLAAAIEEIVARGYGLDRDDLARIYDANRDNRRGFWRHFSTTPHSWDIAREAVGRFTQRRG
jgi:predicted RNA methylase